MLRSQLHYWLLRNRKQNKAKKQQRKKQTKTKETNKQNPKNQSNNKHTHTNTHTHTHTHTTVVQQNFQNDESVAQEDVCLHVQLSDTFTTYHCTGPLMHMPHNVVSLAAVRGCVAQSGVKTCTRDARCHVKLGVSDMWEGGLRPLPPATRRMRNARVTATQSVTMSFRGFGTAGWEIKGYSNTNIHRSQGVRSHGCTQNECERQTDTEKHEERERDRERVFLQYAPN